MTDVRGRLTQWRPGMREYHSGPEISSGLLYAVAEEGLSVALARRQAGYELTTDKRMGRGSWLHALFSGDASARFSVAPGAVTVRRGKLWDRAIAHGRETGVDAVLLVDDVLDCWSAWRSLWAPAPEWPALMMAIQWGASRVPVQDEETRAKLLAWCRAAAADGVQDTPAKAQARAILRRWSPRVAEVSHRWEPADAPGALCRIREDLVARSPSGGWGTTQLKTTEIPLHRFTRRRPLLRSLAFYREGLRDLFAEEPFRQLLVAVRFPRPGERAGWPYPWGIYDVTGWSEDLDLAWDEILYGWQPRSGERTPGLAEITETIARGESHGPEEKGFVIK